MIIVWLLLSFCLLSRNRRRYSFPNFPRFKQRLLMLECLLESLRNLYTASFLYLKLNFSWSSSFAFNLRNGLTLWWLLREYSLRATFFQTWTSRFQKAWAPPTSRSTDFHFIHLLFHSSRPRSFQLPLGNSIIPSGLVVLMKFDNLSTFSDQWFSYSLTWILRITILMTSLRIKQIILFKNFRNRQLWFKLPLEVFVRSRAKATLIYWDNHNLIH